MGLVISRVDVVGIVRGDDAEVQSPREFDKIAVERILAGEVLVLDFDQVVIATEQVGVPRRTASGGIGLAIEEKTRNLARHAPGECDQAIGMPLQKRAVNPGLVIEPVNAGSGDQSEKVPVAIKVACKQGQVVGTIIDLRFAVGH